MQNVSWFEKEEDWIAKRLIIFNKKIVGLTFLEVEKIISLIGGLSSESKVLDLCCGIGRHTLHFSRLGYQVTGVDITNAYLDLAKETAEREYLNPEFIQSDMRSFIRPESFDLIVNLCTSFGYFDEIDDDILVLQNCFNSLKPGGRMVIEILGKEVIAATFQEYQEATYDDFKVVSTSRIIKNWTVLECTRRIVSNDREQEIVAYHRLYSASELTAHLDYIGFRNIKVFGSFNGTPYNQRAKSLVVIAEKIKY